MKHWANGKEKSTAVQHMHLLNLRTAEGMRRQHRWHHGAEQSPLQGLYVRHLEKEPKGKLWAAERHSEGTGALAVWSKAGGHDHHGLDQFL